jgi:hypothetical protein
MKQFLHRTLARDDQIMDDWMAAAIDRRGWPTPTESRWHPWSRVRFSTRGGDYTGTATGSSILIKVDGNLVVGVNMQLSRGNGSGRRRGPIRFDDSDLDRAVATAVAAATLVAEP